MRPAIESTSAFAMLSIQSVRAPSNLANRIAAYPGAAPVVTTHEGLNRTTIHATRRNIQITRRFCQRFASGTHRNGDGATWAA